MNYEFIIFKKKKEVIIIKAVDMWKERGRLRIGNPYSQNRFGYPHPNIFTIN
jgi:hypothetical protein